jgi:RimJ/RimL family protein N-acetyltransferase
VVAYARTAWPDRPIVARIRPDNHQSMRLFTAAGFALAETLADHVMFIHGEERVDP